MNDQAPPSPPTSPAPPPASSPFNVLPASPPPSAPVRAAADREFERWLAGVEVRAMLPMKLVLLVLCVLAWVWARSWQPPTTPVFGVFFFYGTLTAAQAYLFLFDRVSSREVRAVVAGSFVVDVLFITALVWLDLADPPTLFPHASPASDFSILYVLMVLRGFVIFRRPLEIVGLAVLLTGLFLFALGWHNATELANPIVVARLGMIWAVLLMSSFIVALLGRQQDELLRWRERLVRSESLASLGELTAGVAHEINNPIGIIKTYAEYLGRAVPTDDPHHDDYVTIRNEAERCEMIVRRMLDFANPEPREFKSFDLAALVHDTARFVFNPKAGDTRIAVRITAPERLPAARGAPSQIRQALLNILMNARQILIEANSPNPQVEVTLRQLPGAGAPLEITVRDNGPGIRPEDVERAFEPFFTRRREGTGLGLAITRRILEAHEGSIAIWPAPGGGTKVALTIPVFEQA